MRAFPGCTWDQHIILVGISSSHDAVSLTVLIPIDQAITLAG